MARSRPLGASIRCKSPAVSSFVVAASVALLAGCSASNQSGAPGSLSQGASTRSLATAPSTAPVRSVKLAADCPSTVQACVVPGDGGVLAAVNKIRKSAGLIDVVAGTKLAAAQACAVASGSGPSCPKYVMWSGASAQQASQVIPVWTAFVPKWAVESDLKALSVAWAYFPKNRDWACVAIPEYSSANTAA